MLHSVHNRILCRRSLNKVKVMMNDKDYVNNSLSLAVLNLYRCCINLVSQFNWSCYVFLTLMWRTLHLTNQKLSQMHGLLWRTKRKGADLGHSLSLQCPDLFGLISLLLKFFLKQTQSTISINECILKKKHDMSQKETWKANFMLS